MSEKTEGICQFDMTESNGKVESCKGLNTLNLQKQKRCYLIAKRIVDFFLACVGLVFAILPMGIILVLIKLESQGPAIYVHNRIGKNGKVLPLLKFRSMYSNSAEMFEAFTPEQKAEWQRNFKLENDPRITKVGNFLRKSSLDELPQLINILKGELSIVGERGIIETTKKNIGFSRVVAVNSISS